MIFLKNTYSSQWKNSRANIFLTDISPGISTDYWKWYLGYTFKSQ